MVRLILVCLLLSASDTWEDALDQHDGESYIRVAEELAAEGMHSPFELEVVEHLYVLAAVIDPYLRDSAILGLIAIEEDPQLIHQLQSLRSQKNVPLVVHAIGLKNRADGAIFVQADAVSSTLRLIRRGKKISQAQASELRAFSYLFSNGFEPFLQRALGSRRILSLQDIQTTLMIELEALGGPTLWSADYRMTSGRPVALSMSDDLASVMQVDPTKTVRRNNRWEHP